MKKTHHRPKAKYTPHQLLEAEISDLETDLRCAERDGLQSYAQEVMASLDRKRRALAKQEKKP